MTRPIKAQEPPRKTGRAKRVRASSDPIPHLANIDPEHLPHVAKGELHAYDQRSGASAAAAEAGRTVSARSRRARFTPTGEPGKVKVGLGKDQDKFLGQLVATAALGADSVYSANERMNDLLGLVGGRTIDNNASRGNGALHLMAAIAPRDELEGALAMQMAGNHQLTLDMIRGASQADTTDKLALYGSLAVKLQRTFAAQVEALSKLRSGGKQQVEVRYIYVDARGSQNVIGDIAGGGRGAGEISTQAHAADPIARLPFAPGVQVWGPDAAGHAMPVARGEGTEAVQDARRIEPGSAPRPEERELARRGVDARGEGGAAGNRPDVESQSADVEGDLTDALHAWP